MGRLAQTLGVLQQAFPTMAIVQYRSLHPNHVHQLMVTVSKHYYVSKDGLLKYQKKPFEIKLSDVKAEKRSHLLVFTIRDHFSGLFYAEVQTGPELPDIYRFLRSAWSEKVHHPMQGLPELMTIPKSVETSYPGLIENIDALGIRLVEVSSGFQGGVRDIRTIEDSLAVATDKTLEEVRKWLLASKKYIDNQKSRNGLDTKRELWNKEVRDVRQPPEIWPKDA